MKSQAHNFIVVLTAAILLQTSLISAETTDHSGSKTLLEGIVYDADTRQPIPRATIQVTGTGRSTMTNDDGRYRIRLNPDERRLKFSHIAYYSYSFTLEPSDSMVTRDIFLHSSLIEIPGIRVSSRALDPGQRIIVEAIKRKQDILNRIHDYQFDAYTRLVVRDLGKTDSANIWMITETQLTTYWEQPDKYKEIITARKQSSNLDAEQNLVTVGEILNFNRDRIDIGRFSIVSPTAKDALDHYNYYLLDTVLIDSMPTFLLEIEPKNPDEPLFVGTIHIADSTYDVVDIDVSFSRGVDFPLMSDLRYGQRFARFNDEYWMPVEIRFSGLFELELPIPGVPGQLQFSHVASLYSYSFEQGHEKITFDEYILEVAEDADDFDSTTWHTRRTVPLTVEEETAYGRIDSLENLPPSPGEIIGKVAAAGLFALAGGLSEFYRFNRVEGSYFGFRHFLRPVKNMPVYASVGYSFGAKRTEHRYGASYRIHDQRRVYVGFSYVNRIVTRPTIMTSPSYNSTGAVLLFGKDPFDYYRTKGFNIRISGKLVDYSRIRLVYSDNRDFSQPKVTDYSLFDRDDPSRENPTITEGRLRSIRMSLSIDTRPMLKLKRGSGRIRTTQYSLMKLGIEYASPGFIHNDFDFRRYYLQMLRRQRTLGLGLTTARLYAGASDGDLPPQRQFAVDFGNGVLFNTTGFNTLNGNIFRGNRVLAISLYHDFRSRLFVRSGLPAIKKIPFWLSLHGGIFWSEFDNQPLPETSSQVITAGRPYREIGFGLGNLTPFISPLNLAIYFTWQLSDYDTSDFSYFVGLKI